MSRSSLLDSIFNAPEADVEVFADVVQDLREKFSPDFQNQIGIRADNRFSREVKGLIQIEHGVHDTHYVWHICPAHPKRPWSVSMNRVLFAIAQCLNAYLPTDLIVDMMPPDKQWEIKEITVKVNNATNHWAIRDDKLREATNALFAITGQLV